MGISLKITFLAHRLRSRPYCPLRTILHNHAENSIVSPKSFALAYEIF